MLIRFFDITFSLLANLFVTTLFDDICNPAILWEGTSFIAKTELVWEEKVFSLLKFATMLKNSPSIGAGEITLKNDPRVLPFGKFFKKNKNK